jgi:ribosomal protein L18
VHKKSNRTYAQISQTVRKNILVLANVDELELERYVAVGDPAALAIKDEIQRLVELHAAIGFESQFSR